VGTRKKGLRKYNNNREESKKRLWRIKKRVR